MKNSFKIVLLSAVMFAAGENFALAQEKKPVGKQIGKAAKDVGHATSTAAKDVGHATSTAAKDVGKKTSEIAAKGAAVVVDKKYAGKQGPNGEIIYINEKSNYYYVNKAGHRVYLKKSELIDKPIQ